MPPIKQKLEEWWCQQLNGSVPGVIFYPSRADDDSQPPYGIAVADEFQQTTPNSFTYKVEMKIGLVSAIDLMTTDAYNALWQALRVQMGNVVGCYNDGQLTIFGWCITDEITLRDTEDNSFANAFKISLGCAG